MGVVVVLAVGVESNPGEALNLPLRGPELRTERERDFFFYGLFFPRKKEAAALVSKRFGGRGVMGNLIGFAGLGCAPPTNPHPPTG